MRAQALASSQVGLAAPSVSSIPFRAKIPGCDGRGPRAPPRIPSRFPSPRAGPGSLQPSPPGGGQASRALLGGRTGGMLPWCGLSARLAKAACQGVQVPAWIPAPFQGACGEAGCRHLPPSGCTCLTPSPTPSRPSFRLLDTPALFTLPGSSASTRAAVEEQVPDRTPGPSPGAPVPPVLTPRGASLPRPRKGQG